MSGFEFARVCQISESHCGPAVIQMLLGNLGIEVSQEEVAEAGGATQLIALHGMRVDQLALAVKILAPGVEFWYKEHAELADLIRLLKEYRFPVGVEWQGVFETEEEGETEETAGSETEDDDYGHYSVITNIDLDRQELIIVDPYKDFVSQDRIFSIYTFLDRWWDTNEVTDPATGKPVLVEDYHMLFILSPKKVNFPENLGMVRV